MPTERQFELADAKANGKRLKLIDSKTRQTISIGEEITDFRGKKWTLKYFDYRRVYVRTPEDEFSQSFYPSVFGCEVVIEEEKQRCTF